MKKILKKTNQKGITLVALIITIVILLILAGISISALTNQGLFEKAIISTEEYEEKSAREKLQLKLKNIAIEKYTNSEYNSETYLINKLEEEGFVINDNLVIVDGYQFQIDRDIPEIVLSLGKGVESEKIKIVATQKISTDYNSSTVQIEIEYEGELSSIKLAGEELEIPEKIEGKYTIEKVVTENKKYSIYVKNTNEEYALSSIQVTGISEDMKIDNITKIACFVEKVNAGATYEGKTITLENDVDLSSICGADIGNWTPIGSENAPFKGTFDGNGKTISNLYISYGEEEKALFGYNEGTIKNLTVDGSISNTTHVAGVSVYNYGTIENCTNNCNMNNTNNYKRMAGICTYNYGTIKNCINHGNIIASKTAAIEAFGGIVASNSNGIIENCINTGNIEGYNATAGISGGNYGGKISRCVNKGNISGCSAIGGIAGHNSTAGQIYNSYNTGIISGTYSNWNAGIAGYNGYSGKSYIYNCYSINTASITRAVGNSSVAINCYTSGMTAENLNTGIDDYQQTISTESPWENDISPNINSGYPILIWQQQLYSNNNF